MGWMSWREGSTDGVCVRVGKGDAHVRLGTEEGPEGPGVPGWVPAKTAEASWLECGHNPGLVGRRQQHRKSLGGMSQAGHTPSLATRVPLPSTPSWGLTPSAGKEPDVHQVRPRHSEVAISEPALADGDPVGLGAGH